MNKKITTRGLFLTSLLLFSFIYSFASPQQAAAQTSSAIGYVQISSYGGNGTYCSPTPAALLVGLAQTPIYNSFGSSQSAYGCIQSITLTSKDSIQLSCQDPYTFALSVAPKLTGPGTFTENCPNTNGIFLSDHFTVSSNATSTSATTPTITSYSFDQTTGLLTLNGSHFGKFSTSAYINFQNTATFVQIVNAGFITITDTSLQINVNTAYQKTNAGAKYVPKGTSYAVQYSGTNGLSNRFTLQLGTPVAPTGLTATMSSSVIGQVNLSWKDSDTTVQGFAIERASSAAQSGFVSIASTTASIKSYTDDLAKVDITGSQDTYRVRAVYPGSVYSDYSAPASVSNCVSLGGTGHRKVVFMRGRSWNSSVADFIYQAKNVITNGYKTIDPYKTYINQFSFYADLADYDDLKGLINATACGQVDQRIFFTNGTTQGLAASDLGGGFTYYNFAGESGNLSFYATDGNMTNDAARAAVIIHETGHAFAGLMDEYVLPSNQTTGTNPNTHTIDSYAGANVNNLHNTENCTSDISAYRYMDHSNPTYDGRIFGGYLNVGCSYLLTASIPSGMKRPAAYYRPSNISIMNAASGIGSSPGWIPKFNIISCGYIVAAIQGQALTKANAQTHWLPTDTTSPTGKGCYALDTTGQSEIPSVKPVPTTADFVPASDGSAGGMITGSGFTSTGNALLLTPKTTTSGLPSAVLRANAFSAFDLIKNIFQNLIPVAHGQTTTLTYEIDDIPSTDGTSLNFTVPTNIPDGTYTISISALNSPWTSTPYTIIVSGHGAGDPTTGIVSTGGGDGSIAATVNYSCPASYTLNTSAKTCTRSRTTIAATATYSCPTGYTLAATTCKPATVIQPVTPPQPIITTIPATKNYSCPAGGSLNISAGTCVVTTSYNNGSSASYMSTTSSVPATVNYTCPSGYTLNAAAATCSGTVSMQIATSTTTANVWDSVMDWLGSWFR